ncbi:MAG TPA: hypothetical protein VGA85_07165 [Dehalococcoidales bacterium]
MARTYKVRVRVISQVGVCKYGMKVGNEWVVDGLVPGGICLGAWHKYLSQLTPSALWWRYATVRGPRYY